MPTLSAHLDAASAVLLDMDGTLIDSEPVYVAACRDAMQARGLRLDEDLYLDVLTSQGLGLAEYCRRAGLKIAPEGIQQLVHNWKRTYRNRCEAGEARPFPGARDFVARVSAYRPTAIATSSQPAIVQTVLDASGWSPPCAVVPRRSGLRPKPAPDVFAYAAGVLGCAPSHCLVVEDTAKGLAAAAALDMARVAVRTDYSQGPEYAQALLIDRERLYGWKP